MSSQLNHFDLRPHELGDWLLIPRQRWWDVADWRTSCTLQLILINFSGFHYVVRKQWISLFMCSSVHDNALLFLKISTAFPRIIAGGDYSIFAPKGGDYSREAIISHTVEPVYNGPVLSGHPLLSGQFSKSRFCAHTNAIFVTCIRRPPLLSGCGHPVAVLCLSFFVICTCIKRPPLNGN